MNLENLNLAILAERYPNATLVWLNITAAQKYFCPPQTEACNSKDF